MEVKLCGNQHVFGNLCVWSDQSVSLLFQTFGQKLFFIIW